MSDQRTIWVFPPDSDNWYQVDLPYTDDFAEALAEGRPKAWRTLLSALGKLVSAAATD